jgi:allophanate hydrolase subunit 2
MWSTVSIEAGQTLSIEFAADGTRCYLAVAGGIDLPEFMGSRSTYTLVGIGGYEGRELAAGDELSIGEASDRCERVGRQIDEERRHGSGRDGAV